MKSAIFAVVSLLAATAIAQPHHRHQRVHQKRDVVWVTDWDYVTETIGITETIWVSSGFVPPTSSSQTPASTTSSAVESSSTSPDAAQFFQGPASSASSSSVYVAPTPTETSVFVAPTSSSVAPHSTSSPAPYVAPVVPVVAPVVKSSSTPEPVPTTSTPVYVAPTSQAAAVSTPAPAPADTESSSSSSYGASTSGCKAGSPCNGDMTYYTAGLGACGQTNDGSVDKVVALPHALMGTQSNGNPYCGQTITIKCLSTGKTTTATVVDKCMGCDGYSIDLSNAAFDELAAESVGRTTAEWWFN